MTTVNPLRDSPGPLPELLAAARRYHQAGQFAEAVVAYEKVLAIQPDFAEVHNDLGNVLTGRGHFDDARLHYERAIALRPDLFEPYTNLGNALRHQRRFDEAIAYYQQALALNPDSAGTHNELGKTLLDQGQLERALASFNRALAIKPDFVEAHYNRSGLKTFTAGDADLAALEGLAGDAGRLPAGKMTYVHFALAKALDDAGEYDRAFEQWKQGNALKRKEIDFDESLDRQFLQDHFRVFNPRLFERTSGSGDSSPLPIFIVGMSRSGSSLVEQILATHPLVHGGGETIDLGRVARAAIDSRGRTIPYPGYVSQFGPRSLAQLGQNYLASLPPLPAGKTRFTDKTPGNVWYAGLIHLALPNAKIIHTTRDPIDTCLSCYSSLFTSGHRFSYDLAELGRYYRRYTELMEHWRSVLPADAMLDVAYENVVNNLEEQVRRLLDYCGLPWDDRCLSFYNTDRPVSTASNVQVRQPVYRRSLGRWHRYEKHLGPLLAELEGLRPAK
jgi:tetratricopeptide (TPR) repeat protein